MDKRITLAESAALLPAGDVCLGLGGFTLYRRPMAFALALLAEFARSKPKGDLTLLTFTAGLESDILVGAGLVSRVRTCYFGLEAFGLAPRFTQAASEGSIEIMEETEASLALGLRATLSSVGFMPSHAWRGTDLPKLRPDVREVTDPYTGESLTAFPAIHCDLAVIHALQADHDGNVDIGENWGVDRELCYAADRALVTAEKVVPKLERAHIFGQVVTAVVEAPNGAWPTSCYPSYRLDGEATLEYIDTSGSDPQLIHRWAARHGVDLPVGG